MASNWIVPDGSLREVPSFYPLETSSRTIHDSPSNVASRVSDCCRLLSIQATFNNDLATADLITEEHVEMHMSLWKGSPAAPATSDTDTDTDTDGNDNDNEANQPSHTTIIEVQRRNGCAVIYHRYCRDILDAAEGYFDGPQVQTQVPRVEIPNKSREDGENSLLALEIAANLISKDRMDARRLGMESLCLLTDPSKAGAETALLASQVVLFGSVQNAGLSSLDDTEADCMPELGIREAILSLVQFGRLGEYGDFDDDDEEDDDISPDEIACNQVLHNLSLAVLANALEVLESDGTKMSATSNSSDDAIAYTANDTKSTSISDNTNAFLDESKEISNRELIKTLLNVLGNAESKPHDACLSAQCLKSLFQASKKAKRKARDFSAKQIVVTALDVGRRTHVKLETETKNVMKELEKMDDDQGEQQQQQHQHRSDSHDEDDTSNL